MKQLKHEQQDKKNLASGKNEIDYLILTISYDIDVYDSLDMILNTQDVTNPELSIVAFFDKVLY